MQVYLEPTLSVKGWNVPTSSLLKMTMETFVVRRSRSLPSRMVYTTLENTLDQWEMETMRTCSSPKILMNGEIDSFYYK